MKQMSTHGTKGAWSLKPVHGSDGRPCRRDRASATMPEPSPSEEQGELRRWCLCSRRADRTHQTRRLAQFSLGKGSPQGNQPRRHPSDRKRVVIRPRARSQPRIGDFSIHQGEPSAHCCGNQCPGPGCLVVPAATIFPLRWRCGGKSFNLACRKTVALASHVLPREFRSIPAEMAIGRHSPGRSAAALPGEGCAGQSFR